MIDDSIKKGIKKSILFFSVLLTAFVSQAENMKKLGDLDVHFIALNSTFLTPKIATTYGITRSKINALINISVLDNSKTNKPAKQVILTGSAKNLLGQSKRLEFTEVKEGNAIYYLAELSFSHEEIFHFNIDIFDGNNKETLKFTHKFYVDE